MSEIKRIDPHVDDVRFNHRVADARWQKAWDEQRTFVADDNSEKPRAYVLEMFPYPSGRIISAMSAITPWATFWRAING
jgi:valyl-tRNA synthetase